MRVDPQKARNSLGVFVCFFIIGTAIGIAAWLDAGAEDSGAAVAAQGVRGQAARGLFDAGRRGVNRGSLPPLARSRAVAAMNAMPALNAAAGTWTFIGPDSITNGEGLSVTGTCGAPARITVTGRITAIAFGAEGIYLGSASGGVWKSTDGGAHWKPLTDQQVSLAVGALAVVPGPPDTVYVGTGEGNNGCDNEYGQGILKSQDGGASWTQLAAATFDRLSFTKIALETDQPGILYAGTSFGFTGGAAGECFSASSGTAGLYKSTDAGVTWVRRSGAGGLPAGVAGATVDGSGSVYDVAIDPAKGFRGPFTGTVVALNGADCAGSATLSAVDPNNPANLNPFKLTAEPNTAGGYDLDGTLTLTQDPLPGLNPPGICDDFSGTYKCTGTVADLDGAPVALTCAGGKFDKGAGTTLTLAGSFSNGKTDNGTFKGSWSLDAGAGPDSVDRAPLALKSAPTIFAAVGGTGGGLFRSTDAGVTWAHAGAIAAGRRFAMDFAPDGDRFYIAATTLTSPSTFNALYVSTDHGATFAIARGQPSIGGAGCLTEDQGDQDLALAIDPADSNILYIGMIGMYASTDGGASFIYTGAGTHGGQHAIAVTHGSVYLGNDGGFFQSDNGGKSWTAHNTGLGVVQFQGIGLDANAAAVTGGTQDNGINKTTGPLTWSHSADGDGGFALIDQANPAIYFGEHTGLSVIRSAGSGGLGSYSDISPGAAGTDPLQLYPPLSADPSNPERLLLGTIRLWESCHSSAGAMVCNGATSSAPPIWTVLSADLTGGCASGLCDISDIAVAPTKPAVTYVVTSSDGATGPMAWVTQDGTAAAPTFSNITPPEVAGRPLTSVTVSPSNYQEVVITASGFTGGVGGHVFLSTDLGGSWSDISGRLPDIPALSAAFDPAAPVAGLFVGTDIGVFHTADLGNRWRTANLGRLPVVPVYQLRQAKGIVAAATHGRGVWTFTGPFPLPTLTPTPRITSTPKPTPTGSPTPTPIPGHPFISKIPSVMLVGGSFGIQGLNFTAGSMVNFFVATSGGPVNTGPLVPTAHTATSLTVKVPSTNPVGEGFVSLQVVNTDQAFVASNLVFGLLQGSAAAGIPTITGVDGIGLAPTSADPNYATNNVETVIAQGDTVNLSGTGFDVANGVAVDIFCACPGGKVGPFFLNPGNPGLAAKSLIFPLPGVGLPNSPPTGPGSLVVSNSGGDKTFSRKSNAVSVPIGDQITVVAVTQSGATLTVDGTGFSALTVINFFNLQGAKVVNLGGIKGGAPVIPITLVNSGRLIFTVPVNAIVGPAYVQALNPPFVPFTSSGNDPGGAFNLL